MTIRAAGDDGVLRWERRFGGGAGELGRAILATASGALLAVGHSQSYAAGERVLLVRLEPGTP